MAFQPRIHRGRLTRALVVEKPDRSLDGLLGAAGFEVKRVDAVPDEAGLIRLLEGGGYHLLFKRSQSPVTAAVLDAAPDLFAVVLCCIGDDSVDKRACAGRGVLVMNDPRSNGRSVAELVVGELVDGARLLPDSFAASRDGVWAKSAEGRHELQGKTLGVAGLGNIGKKTARRLKGFDCEIVYYDIVRLAEHEEDALGVKYVLFDELLKTSDVVSLHVPLTSLTRNMISDRAFDLMKPTAVLVNTCRGPVVDEVALHKALITRRIAGAGLDVMVDEPPSKDNPLLNLEAITITPHMAGPTWDNWPKTFRNAFDNIQRVAAGREPYWVIPELRR
jgi:phosphoglycerate dehydrogenase-like enzyme